MKNITVNGDEDKKVNKNIKLKSENFCVVALVAINFNKINILCVSFDKKKSLTFDFYTQ